MLTQLKTHLPAEGNLSFYVPGSSGPPQGLGLVVTGISAAQGPAFVHVSHGTGNLGPHALVFSPDAHEAPGSSWAGVFPHSPVPTPLPSTSPTRQQCAGPGSSDLSRLLPTLWEYAQRKCRRLKAAQGSRCIWKTSLP